MRTDLFTFGSCRIGYGSCPLGDTMGPRCNTLLHSAPQILWWLDVIEGRIPVPHAQLKPLWGRHFIEEPWAYDLRTPSTVIVEISSLKTVWAVLADGYRLPVQLRNLQHMDENILHCLPSQSEGELALTLGVIRSRLPDKNLVLVCQQVGEPEIRSRAIIRDTIQSAAPTLSRCRVVDPTALVRTYGPEQCLEDSIHWTPFGLDKLNQLVLEACA